MTPLDEFVAHPEWVAVILVALSVLIVSTLIAADIYSAHVRRSRPSHRHGPQLPPAATAGTVDHTTESQHA